jgi:hypothetical protein
MLAHGHREPKAPQRSWMFGLAVAGGCPTRRVHMWAEGVQFGKVGA